MTEEILGTRRDHEDMIRWAHTYNTSLSEFIPGVDHDVPFDDMRVVFRAPFPIYNWLRYNCFINCTQNHFREKYGEDYLET